MLTRKALVIEDDRDIAALVALHLEALHCAVTSCQDGSAGLARALDGTSWDLVILDLGLPGRDGLDICRQLRARSNCAPILMLTARASEFDCVLGLESGADDYLIKPFSVVELSARVKAMFRRVDQFARRPAVRLRTVRSADLQLDLDRREAFRGGAPIELTHKEFDLLACLMQHPACVFSRSQLMDWVWGATHDAFEHTVNSHINRLRAKLEPDPAHPRYVVTVWGVGYRFASGAVAEVA